MPTEEEPELVADIVVAARADEPSAALEAVAVAGYAAGVTQAALLSACDSALDIVLAGVPEGTDVPADDAIRDLMDRLEGWCPPGAHIEPLPPK
ncbi:hypothetical protein [Amycolatopsis sp. WQ 127309]|uniref:hypothetical protein n=1 Tax=Amycolatopsis sp. WQ 127309 TaxID=2932773 RepID=UPI001FF6FB58|nr:hypothetical protein [Amycolatopsis sp. WQ 127309]UOZ04542.1 hypothetical protein MUY22_37770 [Amycolatopsis sp. WQ 127309]